MKSSITHWQIQNKVVLVRIDANVPIDHGTILDDQRLLKSLPTLNLLLDKGARIILICHLGEPKDHEVNLSTHQLLYWFRNLGYTISFAHNIDAAKQRLREGHKLILLENVRFFPGEKDPHEAGLFARQLAQLGQYYVDDAFGTLHRKDTSIVLLPQQFDPAHTSIGLLVEQELQALNTFSTHAQTSCALMIGGGKVKDKVPLIASLLPRFSALYIGPSLVFSFLKSEGHSVGQSLVNDEIVPICNHLIQQARELNIPLYYPLDYIVAKKTYDGPLRLIASDQIPNDCVGVSIGPKTAQAWSKTITSMKAILVNGLMGSIERPETLTYLKDIYVAIAQSDAFTVIAGGDSAAAAYYFNLAHSMTYISTGGGSTLYYIAYQTLPGLETLKNRTKT